MYSLNFFFFDLGHLLEITLILGIPIALVVAAVGWLFLRHYVK
jgi:hypothetical protein